MEVEESPQIPTFHHVGVEKSESESSKPRSQLVQTSVDQRRLPKFTFLEYPGQVVNYDNAVRTLGGLGKVSDAFASKATKLELKFRPQDPFCNSVTAEGTQICGLLINVRTRKRDRRRLVNSEVNDKKILKENAVDISKVGPLKTNPFVPTADPEVSINLKDLIPGLYDETNQTGGEEEEEEMSRKFANLDSFYAEKIRKSSKIDNILTHSDPSKRFVSIPFRDKFKQKQHERKESKQSDIKVEVLGVVEQKYAFRNGQVCDFQYLPTKLVKGKQVSIMNKVLPLFTDPEKEVHFVSEMSENENSKVPVVLTPAFLSRIDKRLVSQPQIAEEAQAALLSESLPDTPENENLSDPLFKVPNIVQKPGESDFVVVPIRSKRVVFSHIVDFRVTDELFLTNPDGNYVPTEPMAGAADGKPEDVESLIGTLTDLFEKRPIWSKQSLEYMTQNPHSQLKYLIPLVAYFATNGPWRSLWIRLGYDPRKVKEAFEYQLLDYRIPFVYRNYLVACSPCDEVNSIFKGDAIPPKSQMFYQLCDVQIPEVEEIKEIFKGRLGIGCKSDSEQQLNFSPKVGFMDEESLEYCRYHITRHIEYILVEQGRIEAPTLPAIGLLPGGEIPKEKLKIGSGHARLRRHQRMRYKRKSGSAPQSVRRRRNSESSSVIDLEIDRDGMELDPTQCTREGEADPDADVSVDEFEDEFDSENENADAETNWMETDTEGEEEES